MRTVSANASDTELVECLNEWSNLMAAGDFAAAVDFLHPPVRGSGAETWTADGLKIYIENSAEPQVRNHSSRSLSVAPSKLHVCSKARRSGQIR